MNNTLKRKLSAMAAALMLATAGTGLVTANAETLSEDLKTPPAQEEILQDVDEGVLLVDELAEELKTTDLQFELVEMEVKTNIRDNTYAVIAKVDVNGTVIEAQIGVKCVKADSIVYKSKWTGSIWDSTLLIPVAEGIELTVRADCTGLDEDVLDIVQNSTAVVKLMFEIVNALITEA